MKMGSLTSAIERERWDEVALLLVNALLRATYALPPDAIQGLLEALEGGEDAPSGR